ncbi:MAG: fibronectin type III domain-containing protein, partial [Bacteroidales bacterium]|nr:fibronectin type III domain-containing protein [Bacteroidales bacterium]
MKHLATRLLALTMFALLPALSIGQDSIYSCDFEDATENAEWTLLGGTFPNQWYIDTATNNGGSNALYISNDNGTSNAYTVSVGSTQFVFAMRSLTLEVGEYVVSYDWKCKAQNNSDFMRVALIPESIADTLDAAVTIAGLSFNTMPAGWVVADGGTRLSGSSTWANKQATASVITGGNYKLVFIWYNNKVGGSQPPAAVDNITIVRNNCMSPAGLTVSDIDVHEAVLSWSGVAGSNYELRYSTTDNVTTATPYPNTDSTFTSAVLTELAANTRYYAWVRVTCNDEWIAFPQFSTLLACAPVTGVHVDSVDRNNALISWNSGTGAAYEPTGVVVTYGSAGSTQRTLTTTSNYIILTGLTGGVSYTASIRTICDHDTASSVSVSFSTPGCNASIGDGTDSSYVIGPSDNYRYSTYEWIFRANELNMPAGYITSIS